MMSIRTLASGLFLTYLVMLMPTAAQAQFAATPFSDPATGERYHVEAAGALWNPTPTLIVAREALGIVGSQIDAVTDLGIQKKRIGELRFVLRPGRKHKFRINYLPMTYTAQANVRREFTFNGIRYGINLPVATDLSWKTWQVGYEYDFLYRDRWFVGFVMQAKLTDVSLIFNSPITPASQPGVKCADQPDVVAHACVRAPIPAVGGIARVYVVPNISITGELVGFKIPENIDERYQAHYFDFDLYGTVNFNDYVGAQVGYRSLDVGYLIEKDRGDFKMKGLYFGGVVRY